MNASGTPYQHISLMGRHSRVYLQNVLVAWGGYYPRRAGQMRNHSRAARPCSIQRHIGVQSYQRVIDRSGLGSLLYLGVGSNETRKCGEKQHTLASRARPAAVSPCAASSPNDAPMFAAHACE